MEPAEGDCQEGKLEDSEEAGRQDIRNGEKTEKEKEVENSTQPFGKGNKSAILTITGGKTTANHLQN